MILSDCLLWFCSNKATVFAHAFVGKLHHDIGLAAFGNGAQVFGGLVYPLSYSKVHSFGPVQWKSILAERIIAFVL